MQYLYIFSLLFLFFSCFNESNELEYLINGKVIENFDCNDFQYADSIFYINNSAVNKINPVTTITGEFTSIPEGLSLNIQTGEIDINASETGLRYRITFTPLNGAPSCDREIIISGVNYEDKVYVLNQGDFLASPIFNANNLALSPCGDEDDDDDEEDDDEDDDDEDDDDEDDDDVDDSCKFDEPGATPTLGSQGIVISSATGKIDLQKTLESGAFGSTPINGTTLDAQLKYRLNDPSQGALNSIDIRLFYFEKMSDVPQSLLDEIENKRNSILSIDQNNLINGRLLNDNPKAKPRPPYLVVVADV